MTWTKEQRKIYQQEYHKRTWDKRRERWLETQRVRRFAVAIWFQEYKEQLSCARCPENHQACLDFHHINGQEDKLHNVSDMVREARSVKSILAEIKKCIVLCRNCHAKEHYQSIVG